MRLDGELHLYLFGVGRYHDPSRLFETPYSVESALRVAESIANMKVSVSKVSVFLSHKDEQRLDSVRAQIDDLFPDSVVRHFDTESATIVTQLHSRCDEPPTLESELVYWSGHGGWDAFKTNDRLLFCTDSHPRLTRAIAASEVINSFKRSSDEGATVLLFDTCGLEWDTDTLDRTEVGQVSQGQFPWPFFGAFRGEPLHQPAGPSVFTKTAIGVFERDRDRDFRDVPRGMLAGLEQLWPKRARHEIVYGLWREDGGPDLSPSPTNEYVALNRPELELRSRIRQGDCIPIVGAHFGAPASLDSRVISAQLADANGYPFQETREILNQVAEFLSLMPEPSPGDATEFYTGEVLKRTYKGLRQRQAVKAALADDESDTRLLHWVASLGAPIYITTATDLALENALKLVGGKDETGRWRVRPQTMSARLYSLSEGDPIDKTRWKPNPAKPIVWHVYGHCKEPVLLAATESEILARNREIEKHSLESGSELILPNKIIQALGLPHLYVGFDLTDRLLRGLTRALRANKITSESEGSALMVHPFFGNLGVSDLEEASEQPKENPQKTARNFVERYVDRLIPCAHVQVEWDIDRLVGPGV